jgi:glycosyltransferase involved in cell wall biosynthesis
LSLRKKKNLEVYLHEVATYNQNWAALGGLFDDEAAVCLASLKDCEPQSCDAVYRISFPYNFSNITNARTAVFVTSEYKLLLEHQYSSIDDFKACMKNPEIKIITPSTWSAEGFYRYGCNPEQVVVVPHGVDTTVFKKSAEKRVEFREKLGLDGFVFMNVGAMTENKGIGLLLRAFAVVAAQRPDVRLILKGADGLYPSTELLQKSLAELSVAEQEMVISKCSYIGKSLSMTDMAAMYQVADAYVSPYKAEGFNMPVLEAMACGVPVICTRGGATDDFVLDECSLRIDSTVTSVAVDDRVGEMVVPDLDHLIQLMFQVMDDTEWRSSVAASAIEHVNQHYTWDVVTDTLIHNLLPK